MYVYIGIPSIQGVDSSDAVENCAINSARTLIHKIAIETEAECIPCIAAVLFGTNNLESEWGMSHMLALYNVWASHGTYNEPCHI